MIQRARVNAAGTALELFTNPGGNATFYSATAGGNAGAARAENAQILRIYPDPKARGMLLLFGERGRGGREGRREWGGRWKGGEGG